MIESGHLFDLHLERHALGQMLGFDGVYESYVTAGLTREDFYRTAHVLVFDAIELIAETGAGMNLVTVGRELERTGQIREVGHAYFGKLIDGVPRPSEAGVLYMAGQLVELAAKRELLRGAVTFTDAVQKLAGLDDAIDQHVTRIEQVQQRQVTADDLLTSDGQWVSAERELERETGRKIWLGWPTIDEAIDGIRPGEVCGVMARPGVGKTLVLCNVACRVAEDGIGHVVFSLEMPAPQIVERIQRMHFGLGKYDWRGRMRSRTLDRASYTSLFAGQVLIGTPGLSVAEMARRLKRIAAGTLKSRGVALVSIDHLGLIGGDRKMSTYDRVSTQAREIKELAKRHDVAVLLLVQVNRDSGGDGSRELGLGSARDSGVVEEALDYLVTLRRMDQALSLTPFERDRYKGIIFAKVVKNRHNDVSGQEVALRLEGHTLRLVEDPHVQADQQDLAKVAAVGGRRR